MEIKINPYLSISHIESNKGNKGKLFDNRKNLILRGKIIEIKNSSTSTILTIELLQKNSDISGLLGEVVVINL
jgi:hypothetical protein